MNGIEQYASVVIDALALEPGMCMSITGEPEHRRFIEAFTIAAYRKGAKYVNAETTPPEVLKARLRYSREEDLSFFPPWLSEEFKAKIDGKWAVLSLTGNENPELLENEDTARIGILQKAYSKIREPFLSAISSNRTTWCVTGIPTDGWAKKVFKDEAADAGRLWEILRPIYRLDTPSPIDAWKQHARLLSDRCSLLNGKHFTRIELQSPGTELSVGLLEESVWLGGTSDCVDGRTFFPNIPTEEVFTTPDYRTAEGRVTLTKPVLMMGKTVEDGWFVFKEGKVSDYGAKKGKEILEQYFGIDPQAKYLGELALVEEGNPVGSSGLVFGNILFDENAACHIALGNGYTDAVKGYELADHRTLLEKGVNVAPVHTDLMFGSSGLDVWGIAADGSRQQIMHKGKFILGK